VIEKLSKRLKLDREEVEGIILYAHELTHFLPKKKLKKVDLDITEATTNRIRKVAKGLKVSEDAVIGYLLKQMAMEAKDEKI
jgi:hypothetical protein